MSGDRGVERAWVLYERARYSLALEEALRVLSGDPDGPQTLRTKALISLCHSQLDSHDTALHWARTAIAASPTESYGYYVFALAVIRKGQRMVNGKGSMDILSAAALFHGPLTQAEAALREAVRIDPDDAANWSLLAWTLIMLDRPAAALEASEMALQRAPEDVSALQARGQSLRMLGRHGHAGAAAAASIAVAPNDADAHEMHGKACLDADRHAEAADRFAEALRLDPGNRAARVGYAESLLRHSFLYRLAMPAWARRQRTAVRYTVWGGSLVVLMLLALRTDPSLVAHRPAVEIALCVAMIVPGLALLSWLMQGLVMLWLQLRTIGRHALSWRQRFHANVSGGTVVAAIVIAAFGLASGWQRPAMLTAMVAAALAAPLSLPWSFRTWRPRVRAGIYATCAVILGIVTLLLSSSLAARTREYLIIAHVAVCAAAALSLAMVPDDEDV